MTLFLEQRLELGITYGASFGPRFSSAINAQADGVELIRALWEQPLILVNLPEIIHDELELEYLLGFHADTKGSLYGFRVRDWSDWFVTGQALGTGTDSTQHWQLIKTYTVGDYSVRRPITKPVDGSLVVYADGIAQETGWSIDTTNGHLTTNLSGTLTVDFEFDVPVRFEQDSIKYKFEAISPTKKLFTLQPVTLTEIRVTPYAYPSLDPFPQSLPETIDLGKDLRTVGGPSFETSIIATTSEWESRKARLTSPLGEWNIGDRDLDKTELAYFLALFRVCRGRAIPFLFKDWQDQDEQIKSVRFSEDRISVTFDAYRPGDRSVIFRLSGIGVNELTGFTSPPLPVPSYWRVELQGTKYVYSYDLSVDVAVGTYVWGDSGAAWNTGNIAEGPLVPCLNNGSNPSIIATTTVPEPYVTVCSATLWALSVNGGSPIIWDDGAQLIATRDMGECPGLGTISQPIVTRLYQYSSYDSNSNSYSGLIKIWVKDVDYSWNSGTGAVSFFTPP